MTLAWGGPYALSTWWLVPTLPKRTARTKQVGACPPTGHQGGSAGSQGGCYVVVLDRTSTQGGCYVFASDRTNTLPPTSQRLTLAGGGRTQCHADGWSRSVPKENHPDESGGYLSAGWPPGRECADQRVTTFMPAASFAWVRHTRAQLPQLLGKKTRSCAS